MRWSKLIKAIWGLYKVPIAIGTGCAIVMLVAVHGFGMSSNGSPQRPHASAPPRQLLGRVWFDHYPESSRDQNSYAIFLAGGLGLTQDGSLWRSRQEIFDFERRGGQLDLELIQDGRRTTVGFTVESCDDRPPFDLCLTLDENPTGGPTRFYSFGDGEDFAEHLPWANDLVAAARVQLRAVPRD